MLPQFGMVGLGIYYITQQSYISHTYQQLNNKLRPDRLKSIELKI